MNWLLISIGLITGLLVGLTGVGGGAFISLLLLLIVGMPANVAVGTALLFAAVTRAMALQIFRRYHLIDWTVVSIMWLGSLSASVITLIWLYNMLIKGQDTAFIKQIMVNGILIAIMTLFLQPTIEKLSERRFAADVPAISWLQITLTIVAGAMLGVLVTSTSVGMGTLGLIILTQLYPYRMTPPQLVATNVVHAMPLAFFGGIGHAFLGNVNFPIIGWLLIGSIPGALIGALVAALLPHPRLRTVLSATLWIFGLQLWWTVLPSI